MQETRGTQSKAGDGRLIVRMPLRRVSVPVLPGQETGDWHDGTTIQHEIRHQRAALTAQSLSGTIAANGRRTTDHQSMRKDLTTPAPRRRPLWIELLGEVRTVRTGKYVGSLSFRVQTIDDRI